MDAQAFLEMLKSSEPKQTVQKIEQPKTVQKEVDTTKDFEVSNQPSLSKKDDGMIATNQFLEQLIKGVGFDVDKVPNFSEIAQRLQPNLVQPTVEKGLTNLDNHDIIKDISPSRKNDESDIRKEALKRLIQKYKG